MVILDDDDVVEHRRYLGSLEQQLPCPVAQIRASSYVAGVRVFPPPPPPPLTPDCRVLRTQANPERTNPNSKKSRSLCDV